MADNQKTVIQCATPLEFNAFKEVLAQPKAERFGKRQYLNAAQDLIVLWGSIGKVWAAASCEFAIQHWNPTLIVDFGAAGALTTDLKLGDLVLADQIIEHDIQSARPLRPSVMTKKFDWACETNSVVRGIVVSGDKDVQTLEDRARLAKEHRAIAATWESSAIGRICQFHEVPFASVRVITDVGGGDEFLAEYKANATRVLTPAAQWLLKVLK